MLFRRYVTILFFAILFNGAAVSQTATVIESFRTLLERGETQTASGTDGFLRLGEQIKTASVEEVTAATPLMVATLGSSDEKRRRAGISALLSVSLRLDSPALLGKHVAALATILDSPEGPEQRVGGVILSDLITRTATPPDDVIAPLIAFLRRTDRDLQAQAGVVGVLVRAAPDDSRITSAVTAFLSRPMDAQFRMSAHYGLMNPRLKDGKVIERVAAALEDPNEGVRETALGVLNAIGPPAIAPSEPAIRKMLKEPGLPDSLRSAAVAALAKIGHTVE